MNSGCRVTGQFLVLQALLQSLPVAFDAWQARLCPGTASEWMRLSLLPVAPGLYGRYFGIRGCRSCGSHDGI
jgi:hypothetical protein